MTPRVEANLPLALTRRHDYEAFDKAFAELLARLDAAHVLALVDMPKGALRTAIRPARKLAIPSDTGSQSRHATVLATRTIGLTWDRGLALVPQRSRMAQAPSMQVSAVDTRDRVLRSVSRAEVLPQKLNFRVVHVLLFNHCGEIMLQRLPASHDRHPGLWGSSVAGYVAAGETYREAAARKLREELDLEPKQLRYVGKAVMADGDSKKFIGVFAMELATAFMPSPAHFAALQFVPLADVGKALKTDESSYTETFAHVLAFAQKRAPLAR